MIPEGKIAFTKHDLAKFPFITESDARARTHIETLNVKIEDLADSGFDPTLDRAEGRIREAILEGFVGTQLQDEEIELFSFPLAVMMVASTADNRLKRRYALAEAKRVSNLLETESKEKILQIAKKFDWRIRPVRDNSAHVFALHFADFLDKATVFHEKEWKLANRLLWEGEVYLTQGNAIRLLEEEVRGHIEGRLDLEAALLPQNITNRVERLKHLFTTQRGRLQLDEPPKEVIIDAFPPCMKGLFDASLSGRRVSHTGRFALTSFLLNTGMTIEDIIGIFRSFTDFNERMTRYQVEHIAGVRGSRTKYTPPNCDTLRTHGLCPGRDEVCTSVWRPLFYYLRRIRAREKPVPEWE